MNPDLVEITRLVQQQLGRDISVFDETFLVKTLAKKQTEAGNLAIPAYTNLLLNDAAEAQNLFQALTITYSEFFRNSLCFAFLEQIVLPRLIEQDNKNGKCEIRIWSAGCAGGQEAYSLAILLDELLQAHERASSFRIFATDISTTALQTASVGEYDIDMLKNLRLKHLQAYFFQMNGHYKISESIRKRVDFSYHDLLDRQTISPAASIYGDFDLIICCNLLFYYKPGIQQMILKKLYRSLAINGYLVLGDAERSAVDQMEGFKAITSHASIFQKAA